MIARVRLAVARWSHRLFRHSSTGPAGRHCATPARRRAATAGPTGRTTSAGKEQTRVRDVVVGGAAEMEAKLAQVEAALRARGLVKGAVYRNHIHDVGVVSAPGITVWVLRGGDGALRSRGVPQERSTPVANPVDISPVGTGADPVRDSRSRANGRPPLRPVA